MNSKNSSKKNTLGIIKKIDKIRESNVSITFKECAHYLWSFVVLGVNWMIYKKLLLTLLITIVLVATLVFIPYVGIILCILTPVFMGIYGKNVYYQISDKYSKSQANEKTKNLIPSSLLIVWILIILVIALVSIEALIVLN